MRRPLAASPRPEFWLLILLSFALASCAKVSAPNTPGTSVPETRRHLIISGATTQLDTLSMTDPTHAIQRVLASISKNPEIKSSGMAADSGAYAIFSDGVVWLIASPSSISGPPDVSPAPRHSFAPQSGTYIVPPPGQVHIFDAMSPFYLHASQDVADLAHAAGYPLAVVDTGWSPQGLKDYVKAHGGFGGIVYFYGHGALAGERIAVDVPFALWTPQGSTTELDTTIYRADLAEKRIVLMSAMYKPAVEGRGFYSGEQAVWLTRYGMTEKFVKEYLRFDPLGSLVYVDACNGFTSPGFRNAFLDAGATSFLGWDSFLLSGKLVEAANAFFAEALSVHRLKNEGSAPWNRPFNVRAVYDSLRSKGELVSDGFAGTGLNSRHVHADLQLAPDSHSEPIGGGPSSLWLAPSINAVEFLAGRPSRISIKGDVGAGDTGHVTVDGKLLPFTRWDRAAQTGQYRIECLIPESGAGSSGDVVATVRGIRSNAVPITEWRGTMTYTQILDPGCIGQVTWNLHARACVQPWRNVPNQAPYFQDSYAEVMSDTKCSYALSGTYVNNNTTITYSGGGDLVRADTARALGPHFFARSYYALGGSGRYVLVVEVGDFTARGFRTATFSQGSSTTTTELVLGAGVLRMSLDSMTYDVKAESDQLAGVAWTAMPAVHAPTLDTPAAPGLRQSASIKSPWDSPRASDSELAHSPEVPSP